MSVEGKDTTKKISSSKIKEDKNLGKKFIGFFKNLKAEWKRITWASKKDTVTALKAVVIFCLLWIAIVWVMDFGFDNFFTKVVFKTS